MKPVAKHRPIFTAFLLSLHILITASFAVGAVVRHVDVLHGSNSNDGLTHETAFATIQKGIQMAGSGDTILVWPGLYVEDLNFLGKAITVKSAADAAHIQAIGDYAVSFISGENDAAVLQNFVIRDSVVAIHAVASSPFIQFVTVANNAVGVIAESGAYPFIWKFIWTVP